MDHGIGKLGKKYGLIYIDPPWQYQMYSEKGHKKSPDVHYDCMTLDELKDLSTEIIFSTAENAVCVMWTTFAHLDQALELMESYGFKYKTGGPWIKRTRHGKHAMGTGYVLRSSAELFLIGSTGRPAIRNRSTRNILMTGDAPEDLKQIQSIIVDAAKRQHSRKPDQMIPLLEALFDGPYLEIFARTQRDGWDCWGNETDKFEETK